MDDIIASNRARELALVAVKNHIRRLKRSVTRFGNVDQPVPQRTTPLYPYVPESTDEEAVATRTFGRPRIATMQVDCEHCSRWEDHVQRSGVERDMIRTQGTRFYCQHGNLITELSLQATSYVPVREVKQLFLKRQEEHMASQQSSLSSEVTPEKFRQKLSELDQLKEATDIKQVELQEALQSVNLEEDPDSEEIQRRWNDDAMSQWEEKLGDMVEEIREEVERVISVGEAIDSNLNSPASVSSQDRHRREFNNRLLESNERDLQGNELNLGGHPRGVIADQAATQALPVSHQTMSAGRDSLLQESFHLDNEVFQEGGQNPRSQQPPVSQGVDVNGTSDGQHGITYSARRNVSWRDSVSGVSLIRTTSGVTTVHGATGTGNQQDHQIAPRLAGLGSQVGGLSGASSGGLPGGPIGGPNPGGPPGGPNGGPFAGGPFGGPFLEQSHTRPALDPPCRGQDHSHQLPRTTLPTVSMPAQQGAGGQGLQPLGQNVSLMMCRRNIERKRSSIRERLRNLEQEIGELSPTSRDALYRDVEQSMEKIEREMEDLHARYAEAAVHADPLELTAMMEAEDADSQNQEDAMRNMKASFRRKKARVVAPERSTPGVGQRYTHLERVKLPEFDGKFESWPRFRQEWSDLQTGQGTTDAIQLRQLREKLPRNAQDLICGIGPDNGGITAAFSRLEREYGDRDLNILTVQRRLDSFQPKAKESHARVEELCLEVERAGNLLEGMGAMRELERERGLIGRLVNKLPMMYQNLWDNHFTSPDLDKTGVSDWQLFQRWLMRQREIALNAKKRSMQLDMGKERPSAATTSTSTKTCHKCGQPGHLAWKCGAPSTRIHRVEEVLFTKAKEMSCNKDFEQALPELKRKAGTCRLCDQHHSYDRVLPFGTVRWPSTQLRSCPEYNRLSVDERAKKLEEKSGCAVCTSWLHKSDSCFAKSRSRGCPVKESGKRCGVKHDPSLHGAKSKYCQVNKVESTNCDHDHVCTGASPVLLRIQDVEVGLGDKKATTLVLFDPGSTATLITHNFAEKLGLVGNKVTYYLKVVGQGYTKKETQSYKVPLVDRIGKQWVLDVLGIEAITSVDGEIDLSAVKSRFPNAPAKVFHRPAGAVDLLVGSNYEALQPYDGVLSGGLRLLESHFGVGKVLSGTDVKISTVGCNMTTEARHMSSAVRELPEGAPTVDSFHASLKLPTFMEAEELGSAPARHCKKCRDCKLCSYRGRMITRDEEMVVKIVEDSMWLDEEKNEIHVEYPWKPEADLQVNNRGQALAIQKKVESKLLKAGRLEEYNAEMQKQIDRGVAVPRDETELQAYE